jgi:hypothetical protein
MWRRLAFSVRAKANSDKEFTMSKKSSAVDYLPVAGIAKVAAEKVAKKAGAEDRDAKLIGVLAGVAATVIKAVSEY